MKNSIITRYASFMLVIGFFISCSTTNFSPDTLINEGNYQQALDGINAELEKKPTSKLFYQKGKVHGLISENNSVQERSSDYQSMLSSFDSSRVYTLSESDDLIGKMDSLTSYYWNLEQNKGLIEYQKETPEASLIAIEHFNNAILLDPQNLESYKSLSIALYNNGEIEKAVSTLKNAESLTDADAEIYESMGFLYLEMGNPQLSISYYQKANQNPVENKNIAYGLVNAYISQSRTAEAVSFLNELVLEYPNDAKLHNVFGTQLYNQAYELFSNLKTAYIENDSTSANNFRVEIEGISEQAENQLIQAYKMENSNIEFIESLAVFYNNMSGNYFSIYEDSFEADKELIKNKALSLTDFAITYYEQLADSNAQNEEYANKINNLNTLKESWDN
jgi:Flp pilus assembly protein TadD